MNDRVRFAVKALVAILVAAALGALYVYTLYWRHIPARFFPFTRPIFYEADVSDAKLEALEDFGEGEVTERPGLPPCRPGTRPLDGPETNGDAELTGVEVASADKPVALATQCGSEALWVAEQNGTVRPLVDGHLGEPALDITMQLFRPEDGTRSWEMGLESIVFSPDGTRLFVSYSDETGATRVSEYPAPPPEAPNTKIDAGEERPIIAVAQPEGVHNGGTIRFGPDRYLYFGVGDGGARCGIMNSVPSRLYGKILRIDPRPTSSGATYGIPASNPFVGDDDPLAPRPETWVTGVRNPWSFWVDQTTGALWITDVGEKGREEVTYVAPSEAGASLGWPEWQGTLGPRDKCMWEWEVAEMRPPHRERTRKPHFPPLYEYPHEVFGGEVARCSISGGQVYRGARYPSLDEKFVFGDFCSGELLAIGPDDSAALDTGIRVNFLTSSLVGPRGYLWVTSWDGPLVRVEPRRD